MKLETALACAKSFCVLRCPLHSKVVINQWLTYFQISDLQITDDVCCGCKCSAALVCDCTVFCVFTVKSLLQLCDNAARKYVYTSNWLCGSPVVWVIQSEYSGGVGRGNWFIEPLLSLKLQTNGSCSGRVCSALWCSALKLQQTGMANSANNMSQHSSSSACQSLNAWEYFLDNVLSLPWSVSSALCWFFILLCAPWNLSDRQSENVFLSPSAGWTVQVVF